MTFDLARDIRPVTEFRNKSSAFLKDLEQGNAIILTQHGKPAAVIESVASFQRREEELRFLRGLVAGIRTGKRVASKRVKPRSARCETLSRNVLDPESPPAGNRWTRTRSLRDESQGLPTHPASAA